MTEQLSGVSAWAKIARYEWSVRHHWESPTAALRGLVWIFVRRYRHEICPCGRRVSAGIGGRYWWADDDLWQRVVGSRFGVLCPSCFTKRATAKGVHVYWAPREDRPERGPERAQVPDVDEPMFDPPQLDERMRRGKAPLGERST